MERCIHGMSKESCSFCNPRNSTVKRRVRTTKERKDARHPPRLFESEPDTRMTSPPSRYHVVVITRGNKTNSTLGDVNATTQVVHISGSPFHWVVEEILKRAPNLQKLEVVPSLFDRVASASLELCHKRNVKVVSGYHSPELAWEKSRIQPSPKYLEQRDFLENLSEERRKLLDKLVAIGVEQAQMAVRYFCLEGQEYITQRQLADEWGIVGTGVVNQISTKINALLYFLNPSFEVSESAKKSAKAIQHYLDLTSAQRS